MRVLASKHEIGERGIHFASAETARRRRHRRRRRRFRAAPLKKTRKGEVFFPLAVANRRERVSFTLVWRH
ncbi:hypothetical protein PUN28_004097 [Cardiocondyla obscurior]|uniref:Uncharacterized protein n=1 Tax=Cardiocondyla obscurior TaxID=286306 RepID=A0AAW2GPI3_9HYME